MARTPVRRRGFLLRKNGNWRRIRTSTSSTTTSSAIRKSLPAGLLLRSSRRINSTSSSLDVQVRGSSPLNPKSLLPDDKSGHVGDAQARSERKLDDETYVVGRRMTRAMDVEQSRRLMCKAMDVKALSCRKRRNFMRYKIINAHKNIKAIDKGGSPVKNLSTEADGSPRHVLGCQLKGGSVSGQCFHKENTTTNKIHTVNTSVSCRVTRQNMAKVDISNEGRNSVAIVSKQDGFNRDLVDGSLQELSTKESPSLVGSNKRATAVEPVSGYGKLNSDTACIGDSAPDSGAADIEITIHSKADRLNTHNVNDKVNPEVIKDSEKNAQKVQNTLEIVRNLQGRQGKQTALAKSKRVVALTDHTRVLTRNAKHQLDESSAIITQGQGNGYLTKGKLLSGDKRKRCWKKGRKSNISELLKSSQLTINNVLDELKEDKIGDVASCRNTTNKNKRVKKKRFTDDLADPFNNVITLNVHASVKDSVVHSLNKGNDMLEAVKHGNDETLTEQTVGPESLDVEDCETVKFDPGSKCCLVAINPTETGGRQMRPRPLDLEQPLLVLVEGRDEDYYELDGGSFYRMLQQQSEPKEERSKCKAPARGPPSETGKPIVIPSFRYWKQSEESPKNSTPAYSLPNSYIKASSGLKHVQADYDMDDEDEEWLKKYNQSLPPSSSLSPEQFEKIIEILEFSITGRHGYSAITKALQDGDQDIFEECCICNGGENSSHNLILQCSNCHVRVHKSCYGVQERFMGKKAKKWICRKCEAVNNGTEDADVRCGLCCKPGGALKPSTEPHKWAHVVCALYTNETYFVDTDAMEPIDGVGDAEARAKRQRRKCWLCGMREGSVEKCSVPGCELWFHVSCGVMQGASFELQHSNQQVTSVQVFCPKHAAGLKEEKIPKKRGRKRKGRRGPFWYRTANAGELCTKDGESHLKNVLLNHRLLKAEEAEGLDANEQRGIGASQESVEGILLYWLSKRAKHGGALLQYIQHENAAKQSNIFNPVDVVEDGIDMESKQDEEPNGKATFANATHHLQKLWDLARLVAMREKLKLDIYLLEQDIMKANLEALKSGGGGGLCIICKEPQLSLVCTVCNKSGCFYCYRKNRGSESDSWIGCLKEPSFTCLECEKEECQQYKYKLSQNVHSSDINGSLQEGSMCEGMVGVTKFPIKKPYVLLPRSDSVHQDKLATEAFWDQSSPRKTVLVSDLFKDMQDTSVLDIPKLSKRH